ncbi:hypothetical protein GOODEAATRI_028863 [Goodea atripinnis]|uniref:Uncharacterized protein n=1 Tax=Goodea atripinnis TaxID=208336 RepID=A0ABV0PI58_9TELE
MALLSCPSPVVIKESHLEGWEVIGSGGFGQIYKARHQQWCCDVAIKLLHYDDGIQPLCASRPRGLSRSISCFKIISTAGVGHGAHGERNPGHPPGMQLVHTELSQRV